MDAFTGEIRLFPYAFIPSGWLLCDGSSQAVQSFPALYSVIGNKYGGDTTKFNLPDLNGRVAMGMGANPSLTSRPLNSGVGADAVTLTYDNFAPHTHTLNAQPGTDFASGVDIPTNQTYLAQPRNTLLYSATAGNAEFTLAAETIGQSGSNTGGGQRSLMQPYLTLAYCICQDGIYPQRQ
ncbi:tail fiber protein [Pseudomonas vlassakiae]|uniref:phage tail protein n=1 Tax=Pseudomonas TaxID=286 RepID=UPI0006D3AE7F|nr:MULTISPECIES: tail fiber protein [Pseudomonas]MCU0124382.1 tail fiber protein [Pseudomonas vlassakiae]HCV41817.1 phage tail protein [Pseudomonas sp.]